MTARRTSTSHAARIPTPSIQRRLRAMRVLYCSHAHGGASPAPSASICRSESGTGAKKPRNSVS
eukprot:14214103-Alexandrium_andersonii.AAC.1